MMEIFVFGAVVVLFFVWLLVKSRSQQWCVLCAAVSTTWAGLVVFRLSDVEVNETLLALLLGASATGGYYWIVRQEKLQLFKLPIFLTLAIAAYQVAVWSVKIDLVLLLVGLWLLFGLIALVRVNGTLVKKIIECCRNW